MNAPVMQTITEVTLDSGDVLYREGDDPENGYLITSGEICIFQEIDGRRVNIETRERGATLGEVAILTDTPFLASAEAMTPCRIFKIPKQQILHKLSKVDPLLKSCLKTTFGFTRRHAMGTAATQKHAVVREDHPETNALIEQLKFEKEILDAIEDDQFSMVYQPIIKLADDKFIGAEALMRWHHPVMGHIPPDRFITAAETMGEICALTDFALMESCAMLNRMRKSGKCDDAFFVNVNISNTDLARPEFFDFLLHVLDINDLTANHIKLEITETELVLNCEHVRRNLERLHAFNLGIAIDDFGTGYSNLAYIKEIPLTALKIDRAFAGDASTNPTSHSIVKMITTLGHELGVRVVAEGLETEKDVQAIRDIGCDYAQGYHFDKPMPEADLAARTSMSESPEYKVA